jgi:hypothetical protein
LILNPEARKQMGEAARKKSKRISLGMPWRRSIWRCLRKPEVTGNELRVAGNWWKVEKIWNRGKFACGIGILDYRKTLNIL